MKRARKFGFSVNDKRPTLLEIFLLFLKIGALGFGGPFALLTFLEREIVQKKQWMSSEHFWEATAIGQLTPGPIFSATAFCCGYRLRGFWGSVAAAVGSTLPSFVLAILFAYLYVSFEKLPQLQSAVLYLLAVVVGLLLAVVWKDRSKFFKTRAQWMIGIAVFVLLSALHLNPLAVMLAGGIVGAFFFASVKPA